MKTDHLDQRSDLRLGGAQQNRATALAKPPGQHRQIHHQRRVGEHEVTQIDHDVSLGTDGANHRLPPTSLRGPVLLSRATEDRRLWIEVDDVPEPTESAPLHATRRAAFRTLICMITVDEVTDALREVIDPELGLDFVELGLIYEVDVDGEGAVRVTYTLTSPGCPIGPQVSEQIEEFVGELDGVTDVQPTMTFSPPWTPERMSEDAKFALGF